MKLLKLFFFPLALFLSDGNNLGEKYRRRRGLLCDNCLVILHHMTNYNVFNLISRKMNRWVIEVGNFIFSKD